MTRFNRHSLWFSFPPPLLVFLAAFTLFSPSIAYPLVDYDDPVFIARNHLVLGGLSWTSVKTAFSTLHGDTAMYSPLLWISWMCDVSLFGASAAHPWPFHFGNVLLHALNAALLYFILRRCRATPWPAALLALLWACHPLRVESVAWVTERKDTLSTFFAFASILFYLSAHARPTRDGGTGAEPPPPSFYFSLFTFHCGKACQCLALLAFAAGLLVKPMLVTLPFLFLLFDVFPLRRISLDRDFSPRTALRLLLEKLPFFLLSAAASILSIVTQTNAIRHDTSLLGRLARVPLHYAFYLVKTFLPTRLAPLYHPIGFSWSSFVPVVLVLVALAVSAWRRRLDRPAWSLGILAFFGLFVPVVGFFHLGVHFVADRYAYLPAIGLSIAFIPFLDSPSRAFRLTSRVLAAVALLALCPLTLRTLPVWSSSDAFYECASRDFPDHPFLVARRARALVEQQGDFAAAEALLDGALADDPDDDALRIPKALCIAHRVSPAAACDYLLDRPASAPLLTPTELLEAAQYALRAGLHDRVRDLVSSALPSLPPSDALRDHFLYVLFASALLSGDTDLVRDTAARIPSLAGRTDFSTGDLFPYYLAQWTLLHREDAWEYFRAFAETRRDSPPDLNNIAWLLATAPGWNPAPPADVLAIATRAATVAPNHPVILDTLAAAQANAGDFPSAAATARQAISLLPPDDPLAQKIQSRLSLYLQNTPFRDTSTTP